MFRRTITWLSVGLALGLMLAMWRGPQLIQWWWKQPGANPSFSCDSQIQAATEWLVKLQLGVGAATGVFIGIVANVLARWRTLKKAAKASAASAQPQP